jgi:predicted lipid-binding transport protein (Tim44 family)
MQPAMAGAGNTGNMPAPWNQPRQEPAMERSALPLEPASNASSAADGATTAAAPVARAFVPAAFDSESFERTAKMIFIRMQAANDTADLDDLRRFTTPELFASLRLELQERGPAAQATDVVKVDAKVLDIGNESERQIVSVRFQGQVIEEKGGTPTDFNEVWHLVRPHDGSREWAIAGIEQMN